MHAKRGVMEVKWLVEGPADSGASMMKVSWFKGGEEEIKLPGGF